MDNDMPQQIEKRLAELPEDVRNAVLSVEWEQKVQAIAAKNALHIDQAGALGDTTLMAMLGFFDMADFPSHLAQELAVPPEKASAIAAEVSSEVFMPIRESLRKFTERAKPAQPAAQVVAPVPPPAQTPKPDLSAAERMLENKTVSTPAVPAPAASAAPVIKQEPPKPAAYSADPYREPPM